MATRSLLRELDTAGAFDSSNAQFHQVIAAPAAPPDGIDLEENQQATGAPRRRTWAESAWVVGSFL
jgi:hypothetical protein